MEAIVSLLVWTLDAVLLGFIAYGGYLVLGAGFHPPGARGRRALACRRRRGVASSSQVVSGARGATRALEKPTRVAVSVSVGV